jgi:hypothetical protein
MQENWLSVRWETPVSDAKGLMMKLCCHDGDLDITLDRSSVSEVLDDIQLVFKKVVAFRSILERFRTELWNYQLVHGRPGRTFIIDNSPWISELQASDPVFASLNIPNVRHYVIATDWDVLEILSSHAPVVVTQNYGDSTGLRP